MDLIAIIRNNPNSAFIYKKVNMNNELTSSLSAHFENILKSFILNKTRLPLDILYKPHKNELFQIKSFTIDQTLSNALSNSAGLDSFDLHIHADSTVGIMTKINYLNQTYILFQSFDNRKLLARKLIAWQSNNTFQKLSSAAFTLGNTLTAVFRESDQVLFFQSFHSTSRFLNLESLMVEATSSEVESFFESELWQVPTEINKLELSSTNKKLIKAAILNEITSRSVADLIAIAEKVNFQITLTDDSTKIVLPHGLKFTQLLRFFTEHYLISPMTGNSYYTNSRRIN